MNRIEISEETKNKIREYSLPSFSEIPDIGLFLDQTAKFVISYLEPLEGITITSSMISNYVKMKLITNPVKKQYYREQIADVIFIALVKSVLSLEEAEKMLRIRREHYDAQHAYEYFRSALRYNLLDVFDVEKEQMGVKEADMPEKELLQKVVTLIAHKIYLNEAFRTVE